MKKYVFTVIIIFGLLFAISAFATSLKIGTFDLQKVMMTKKIQALNAQVGAQLTKKLALSEERLKTENTKLQQHLQTFTRDATVMSCLLYTSDAADD